MRHERPAAAASHHLDAARFRIIISYILKRKAFKVHMELSGGNLITWRRAMRRTIGNKYVLMTAALLLAIPFINVVNVADADSYKDRAITAKVEEKLKADSGLMGSGIMVETKDGEVTLKGTVNSHSDFTRAGQLAYHVDGVKKVDNRLKTVNTPHYKAKPGMTDCQIGANWC
jgi:hypothetical protein